MINPVKEIVYADNAKVHDIYAANHDRAVPYIFRKRTRDYYWSLLSNFLEKYKKSLTMVDVLELGCGTGTYTDLVLSKDCRTYTGVDISPNMIKKAKNKIKRDNCKYFCSSLEAYATTSTMKFDVIFSFSFLHHLPSIEEALSQIRQLLKPGGIYIALHEEIPNRSRSVIEKIDGKLQVLFGYNGWVKESLMKRFLYCLPGRIGMKYKINTPNHQIHTQYVDYQINRDFNLSKYMTEMCEIKKYSFLAFPELLKLSRPENFQMLILRK